MLTNRSMRTALLGLSVPFLAAAAQPNPAMQRANALVSAQKYADAIAILDSLTAAAIPTLERATTYPVVRPVALYNLGLAYSLNGQMDSAFARLRTAKATGRIDMTQLGFDSDAGPVRSDARYAELFPTAAEFAAPFIENVRMLAHWTGENAGEQFGWIARDVGDVDGDGIHDVVTSAPTAGANAGTVMVLSTRKQTRLWSVSGRSGDQLGLGVGPAGDVNGDGVPDVVAGGPGGEYILMLSGKDGSVIRRVDARSRGEQFGVRVNGAGDVNGDGFADVLAGASLSDRTGVDAGAVYVISGRDGTDLAVLTGQAAGHRFGESVAGFTHNGRTTIVVGASGVPGGGRTYVYTDVRARPAFQIDADSTGVALGAMFVSIVGDVNRDGVPDVYASDWSNRAKGPTTGRVYVHSGADGARIHALTGEFAGNGFGIGSAEAGDVDRDGYDDLIVGAWQFAQAAPAGGKLYLYSGRDGRLVGSVTGRVMGETLGFDATGIGDVDGDSVPDLLVTSAWSAIRGARSGCVMVLSGADVLRGARK
jgi:FG-GAP repeat